MTESKIAYNSCDPHRMLVLSLKPRFAEAILSGNKTIELRRVEPRIAVPTRALIYASTPTRSLIGQCVVHKVLRLPLATLWQRFGTHTALTHREYRDLLHRDRYRCRASCCRTRPDSPPRYRS